MTTTPALRHEERLGAYRHLASEIIGSDLFEIELGDHVRITLLDDATSKDDVVTRLQDEVEGEGDDSRAFLSHAGREILFLLNEHQEADLIREHRRLTAAKWIAHEILGDHGILGKVVAHEDGGYVLTFSGASDDVLSDIEDAMDRLTAYAQRDGGTFVFELDERIIEETRTGLPTIGFHMLCDTAWRCEVVGHFDGKDWWMPGSDRPFAIQDVMGPDGSNHGGRFNRGRMIVTGRGGAAWRAVYGRVA